MQMRMSETAWNTPNSPISVKITSKLLLPPSFALMVFCIFWCVCPNWILSQMRLRDQLMQTNTNGIFLSTLYNHCSRAKCLRLQSKFNCCSLSASSEFGNDNRLNKFYFYLPIICIRKPICSFRKFFLKASQCLQGVKTKTETKRN